MKKALIAAVLLILSAFFLLSCGKAEVLTVETEELLDLVPDVTGTWRGDNTPIASLVLYDDGTYELLDQAFSMFSGGYIVEGEYVVLDGYGVDDPDLLYALRFDPENNTLSNGGGSPFFLARVAASSDSLELDSAAWFGTYSSELGNIVIGQGASNDVILVAVTPRDGVTKIVSVTLETNARAYCDSFYLTLVEGNLNFVGMEEELVSLSGIYAKV